MIPLQGTERWHSRTTFVLALSMATVGFGNLWRFGWLMGEHGGAPFLLSYVFCLLVVGVPLLAAEIILGIHGRGSPLSSVAWAISSAGRSRLWLGIPLLTCLAAMLMLALCLCIGGWALLYAYHQQLGSFAAANEGEVAAFFRGQLEHAAPAIAGQLLMAAGVVVIAIAGVRRGLGLYAWTAVPLMLWLTGVLVRYALEFGDLDAAGEFLFAWQPLDFDRGSFLAALGHALFTLSVGVAVGMSFGAYAPARLPVVRSVLAVALFDLVLAVAAAVAVYPLLAEVNVAPVREFALLFLALPYAYGALPFGDLYGALFFVLVAVVALGSAVALMEPLLGVMEQQLRLRRRVAAPLLASAAAGLAALATTGISSGAQWLEWINSAASSLLMPLAMLLLALFVAWRLPRHLLRQELAREPDVLFGLWYFLLRFVAAPVIGVAWLWLTLVPATQ